MISNCKHCQKPYAVVNEENGSYFCRDCQLVCRTAYITLKQYIQDNGGGEAFSLKDIDILAAQTGVAKVFVQKFMQEGQLSKAMANVPDNSCQRCRAKLKSLEKKYCRSCSTFISDVVQDIAENTPGSVAYEAKRNRMRNMGA